MTQIETKGPGWIKDPGMLPNDLAMEGAQKAFDDADRALRLELALWRIELDRIAKEAGEALGRIEARKRRIAG